MATRPSRIDADDGSAADRRLGQRHSAVLMIGKVTAGDQVGACLVHDISAGGLKARFLALPAVGDALTIEMRGLAPVTGTVRWVHDGKAGIQFDRPQDIDRVLHQGRSPDQIARPPRFALSTPVLLRLDSGRLTGGTIDISAGGAKLAVAGDVAVGQTGQLTLTDTGAAMFGRICWVHQGQCGFRFCTPLSLAALDDILRR